MKFFSIELKTFFLECNCYHNLFYVKHNIANKNGCQAIAFNYKT